MIFHSRIDVKISETFVEIIHRVLVLVSVKSAQVPCRRSIDGVQKCWTIPGSFRNSECKMSLRIT